MKYVIHVSEYPFRGDPPRMYSFSGTFRQLLEQLNGIDKDGFDIVNGETVEHYTDEELIKFITMSYLSRLPLSSKLSGGEETHTRGEENGGTQVNEFSVCQFFMDESYEYVRHHVSMEEAVKAFQHYTTSVGARIGTTKRVIITDGGDCINAEWKYGEGLTYPPKEEK